MKRIYRLSIPVVLVAALSGCYQGQNANTTIQDETGNGIAMVAGDMEMESVTIVADDEGTFGTVSADVVNSGVVADRLEAILVNGQEAALDPEGIEIAPQTGVSVEPNGDLRAEVPLGSARPGEFVEVTFRFAASGDASDLVLIVPPVGYYESVAPQAPSASPTED